MVQVTRASSLSEKLDSEELGTEAYDRPRTHINPLHQITDIDAALLRNDKKSQSILSVLQPASPLPPEILCIIFKLGQRIHDDDGYSSRPTHLERHFPLIISHVCHRWREISINMASLWTRIDYGADRAYACELRSSDLVTLYLQRSAGRPLDIFLSSRYYSYYYTERDELDCPNVDFEDVQCAVDSIFANAFRWRSLNIKAFGRSDFREAQVRLRDLAAPILKRLWFDGSGEPGKAHGYSHILRGGTPSLELVKLYGGAVSCCCPPLASVQALVMSVLNLDLEDDSVSCRTFRDILAPAVSLTTLHVPLEVIHPSSPQAPAVEQLAIPTLRYLKVDGSSMYQKQMRTLFDLILAPKLECFVFSCISTSMAYSSLPYASLPKFPALRTLQFENTPRSHCDLINEELIKSFPNIRRLNLIRSPFANALHFLSTTTLWPSLDTLQLELDFFTPQLVEMLRHRIQIQHPIGKLRLVVGESHVVPDLSIQNLQVEILDSRTYRAHEDTELRILGLD